MTDRDLVTPAALRRVGLTGRTLARICGRNPSAVSAWSTGAVPVPQGVIAFLMLWQTAPEHERTRIRMWAESRAGKEAA
jgi:hypothetical protein